MGIVKLDPGTEGMRVPSYVNGRLRDLYYLTSADVDVEDVASTLAKINRYAGRTPYPYSVAQHAVLVGKLVQLLPGYQEGMEFYALHHDDTEAFMGDIIGPLKRSVPVLSDFEDFRIWPAVRDRFGLADEPETQRLVKLADQWALTLEQIHIQRRLGIHTPYGCHLPEHPYDRRYLLSQMNKMHWRMARDQYLDHHFLWMPEVRR